MKRRVLRMFVVLGLFGALGATIQGCSISRALSGPAPVAVERVRVGESRNSIVSTLGIPKNIEINSNSKTEIYEFTDGYSNGSKIRVILYMAGDLFTLGLSELVFWPIELAAGDGTQGRAIVSYGLDDIAKSVLLTKADGSAWNYATGQVPVSAPIAQTQTAPTLAPVKNKNITDSVIQ